MNADQPTYTDFSALVKGTGTDEEWGPTRLEPDTFRWATPDECEEIIEGRLKALWASESDTGNERGYLVKCKDAEALSDR